MTMSKLAPASILALLLLTGAACSDDDGDVLDGDGTVLLHYDGDNVTAPLLAGATYEAAARFTIAQTDDVSDGELTEVRFYIASPPASCTVKVYAGGTASSPGAVLYSEDVTAEIVADSWNEHVLGDPVDIPNDDLWIGIEFSHVGPQSTIGCDAGPAAGNGDWLYSSIDDDWIPFDQRTAASINWNIRGKVKIPE
jgi:hypothetical protein